VVDRQHTPSQATLKQERKLLGLTQREAAGVMGVPYRTWQNWENVVNTMPPHSEWYWDYHLLKIMDLRNWK